MHIKEYFTNKIALFLIILFGGATMVSCQSTRTPKAPAVKVNFEKQLQILRTLRSDNKAGLEPYFQQISETPDAYIPPILYKYAIALFEKDKKEEEWFWYFVAKLRGRIDANLTSYKKASQFVSVINDLHFDMISPKNKFESPDQMEQIVKEAVNYVRNNNVSYDHNWIMLLKLHTLIVENKRGNLNKDENIKFLKTYSNPTKNDKIDSLMKPKSTWDDIKQKTIDEFHSRFQKRVQNIKQGNLKIQVAAVPFNYTPYEIGRIQFNGKRILGVFPPADEDGPSGGASTQSGLRFEPGPVTVTWMIGGVVGENPHAGEHRTAKGFIPEPPEEAENWKAIYLGIHIYPDTVKFTFAPGLSSALHQP